MTERFGEMVRRIRLEQKLTLREFCLAHGFDPGNISKIERCVLPPPRHDDILSRYASALGIKSGEETWFTLLDCAAAESGDIPSDLKKDERLLRCLPIIVQSIRGDKLERKDIDRLVEIIREG